MVYALNLLYSLWCSSRLSYLYEHSNIRKTFVCYFILFSPIWLVWLLICGGQFEVGTDYSSYYSIFEDVNSGYYYAKGEWLFAYIVETGHSIGLPPQGMFFVFYFCNFLFFFRSASLLEKRYVYLFILLYITLSTVFNNQLNGLRQYSAIYIITYGIVSFYINKSYWKYLFWIMLAGGIHASSYLALPFCFLLHLNISNIKIYYFLVISSSLFSLFGSYNWLTNIVGSYLPTHYLVYIDSGFNSSNDLIKIATKLFFVPLYLLSIHTVKDKKITDMDKYLFKIGLFAYSIRLFFLENIIFNRIGQLFVLVAIFPLYIYMKYLYLNGRKKMLLFIIMLLMLFYFAKTLLFPSGEYLYQSIYFR